MVATFPPQPLEPYVPSAADPWDLPKVAHLYRRAAFGATWKQLVAGVQSGPEALVDHFFNFDPADDPFNAILESLAGFVDVKDARSVQSWWVHRALNTPRPLQEKMAMLWHRHFATSAAKVSQDDLMHQQIELFRKNGLGRFRDLLIAVGRNPAMLVWLDGRDSKRRRPNENYSRELLELFMLGSGNFTEADVKETARCFTGWELRGGKAVHNPNQFDSGEKTILGASGPFNDESAIDLLLKQPAAGRHLARRLLFEFVHPDPDAKLVDALADLLRDQNWEIKPVLRTLLRSRVFYSGYAYRSRIKSPAELSLGLAIALGGKIKTSFVRDQMNRMGQSLLYPPNVKGWDGHEAWINASTYLVRMNYGWLLVQQRGTEYARTEPFRDLIEGASGSPADVVGRFVSLLLDGHCDERSRATLTGYFSEATISQNLRFSPLQGDARPIRSLIRLITAMPEFQLC